jgi:hypothetical protein
MARLNVHRWAILAWSCVVALGTAGCHSSQRTLFASSDKFPVLDRSEGDFFKTSLHPGRVDRLSENLFSVQVGGMNAELEPQIREDSCWAACSMALLRHAGVKCEQKDLIRQFGTGGADEFKLVMAVAADQQAARQVSDAIRRSNENNSRLPPVTLAPHTATSDDLVESLARGEPMVVGLVGADKVQHLRVVCGAEFAQTDPKAESQFVLGRDEGFRLNQLWSGEGSEKGDRSRIYVKYAIAKLYCYDPLPSRGPMTMTGAEGAAAINFIISRSIADSVLKDTYANWEEACRNPLPSGNGTTHNWNPFGKKRS